MGGGGRTFPSQNDLSRDFSSKIKMIGKCTPPQKSEGGGGVHFPIRITYSTFLLDKIKVIGKCTPGAYIGAYMGGRTFPVAHKTSSETRPQ